MTETVDVDVAQLREEVQTKYRGVATAPNANYHFHTGRRAARRFGYDASVVDSLRTFSFAIVSPTAGWLAAM